jgi:hypothetical protein
MPEVEPILAICGLDCAECTIFQARTDPVIARRIADWFVKERGVQVRPEQIRCAGCRGDRAEQWSGDCAIRTCAEARGLAFCSGCADFPCTILVEWACDDERHSAALARLHEMRGRR